MEQQELAAKLAEAEQTIARLRQENSQIQELDQLKNTFIATASHQLRTPLTQLKWVLSVFQSDPEISKMTNQVKLIDQAFAGVDRIIDTVNDLVNASRIQNGRLPFSPQAVDAAKVINDIIKRNLEVATSRDLRLEVNLQSIPATLPLDPILFQEAIENLVSNALDYAKAGTIIHVNAQTTQDTLEVSVENSGIGISQAEVSKIGRPFFRGQEAIMSHPDGSGLGLYLVKAIAEAHNGHLELVNTSPESTLFKIFIPISETKKEE